MIAIRSMSATFYVSSCTKQTKQNTLCICSCLYNVLVSMLNCSWQIDIKQFFVQILLISAQVVNMETKDKTMILLVWRQFDDGVVLWGYAAGPRAHFDVALWRRAVDGGHAAPVHRPLARLLQRQEAGRGGEGEGLGARSGCTAWGVGTQS